MKKRICLFAGYDKEGKIKDYVLFYLEKLSVHCDIYYLADCMMENKELDKLKPYVKGAWASRHEKYDWGSYSELAKNYVGWEKIEEYEELILANDSNYCVGSFDKVFSKIDSKKCDFFGLIPIKIGIPNTVYSIPRKSILKSSEYPYHICSYFLVFKKNLFTDISFKFFLNNSNCSGIKKIEDNF